MAKKTTVSKRVVPAKSDGRTEEAHVQPSNPEAATPPEQDTAPAFAAREADSPEGVFERRDLIEKAFGKLNRGTAPDDPAQWFPTAQ
jgi:hypothetical protein